MKDFTVHCAGRSVAFSHQTASSLYRSFETDRTNRVPASWYKTVCRWLKYSTIIVQYYTGDSFRMYTKIIDRGTLEKNAASLFKRILDQHELLLEYNNDDDDSDYTQCHCGCQN